MRVPYVCLSVNGAAPVRCYPGAILGRMGAARVQLASPWVSEAHALVSARDDALHLLALRRPLLVGGAPVRQVRLGDGVVVGLAPDVAVSVAELWFPGEGLALVRDAGVPIALDWRGWSIQVDAEPWLQPAADPRPGADGAVWCTDGEPWTDLGGAPAPILPGATWDVRGRRIAAVTVPRTSVAWTAQPTERPLRISVEAGLDAATIIDEAGNEVRLGGQEAQLLFVIAREGGAVSKRRAAKGLWGAQADEAAQSNLERNVLHRLRRALRLAGVRDDLVVNRDGQLSLADGVAAAVRG